MPKNIGNRKIEAKKRDLGSFNSVTQFMMFYAEQMKAAVKKNDSKKKQSILNNIHKARITTKQFKTFYEQQK